MKSEELFRVFRTLACFLMAAIAFAACSSLDCPMNNMIYATYALYKSDGSPDTLRDSLTVITFQRDLKQDPVAVNSDANFSSIRLPISYEGKEDVFYFLRKGTVTTIDSLYAGTDSVRVMKNTETYVLLDTVTVSKTDRPHFESVECNPSFFHTLTGVQCTHYGIDSVVINHPDVNYDSTKEHLHIYFSHR